MGFWVRLGCTLVPLLLVPFGTTESFTIVSEYSRTVFAPRSHWKPIWMSNGSDDDPDDDSYCEADEEEENVLLLRTGILSDIQYAPVPDGFSHNGKARYYRHALEVARWAAQHFQRENVDLVLNLGDIVDGKCQTVPNGEDEEFNMGEHCIQLVMDALAPYNNTPGKILHSYGNHCLYNLDRPSLQTLLGIPFVQEPCGEWVGYYSHVISPKNGIRFVVLDSYDIALLRRRGPKRLQAVQLLSHKNQNFPQLENSPQGLIGLDRRFVAFNGGVGPRQLQWLRNTLEHSRQNNEMVILLSHQPILPESSSSLCLIWNYHDVLQVLREYKDVVAASFAGHAHKGGYHRDEESGIHFRVFEAVLESPHPFKTYAIANIFKGRLEIEGFGNCQSATYSLDHLSRKNKLPIATSSTVPASPYSKE